MNEMQKIRAKRQVINALNQNNRPALIVSVMHDLLLDLNILI